MTYDPRPWAKGLRRLVIWHLARISSATVDDLAELCGQRRECIAPRLTELAYLGEVEVCGTCPRQPGERGQPRKVWRIVKT